MKKVILKSLEMTNFKGEEHRLSEFNREATTISGDNKTGKSRHFDAFMWLLFGKDQFGRTNHEIFTMKEGKMLEKVDATVQGVLEVDGVEVTLSRTFRQDWVRKRGAEEATYEGNTTVYSINGVDGIKAGEYKAHIDSIIDENVFKLLTNPTYFLNLKWEEQRSILFLIAGTISDAEVLDGMATLMNKDAIANLTNLINEGKDIAQFKKELASKRLRIKKELDLIPSRIDQTIKMKPEEVNFEAFEKELESIDAKIKAIDTELEDISQADKEVFAENRKIQESINKLKVEQQDAIHKANIANQEDAYKQNGKRREIVEALTVANKDMAQFSKDETERLIKLRSLQAEKEELEKELTKLREQWGAINEETFNEDNLCPTCSQPIPIKEGAREAFETRRRERLEAINTKGQSKSEELEVIVERIKHYSTANDKTAIQERIKELREKLQNTPHVTPEEVIPTELPSWQAVEAQILVLESSIKKVTTDTTEIKAKKAELVEERDDIKLILNDKVAIEKSEAEVVSLNNQMKVLSSEIAQIEKQEFQIAEFTKVKIKESEARINSLFEIVNFRLFDYTFDGNEFEVCSAVNQEGVLINATNNAEKVNAGLDIINVLCKFNNVTAPIFIDNREGVNKMIKVESQIINLVVTKEPLKVE